MKTVAAILTAASLALVAAGCGGGNDSAPGQPSPEPVAVAGGGVAGAPGKDLAAAGADFSPVQRASGSGLPGITVVGTGTASAVPDVSDWSFGVQADAASAADALKAASASSRRIVAALRNAGVERKDIRTDQVSIYPHMSSDGRSVDGYSASASVSAVVRDIGRAGKVVDAAVQAGANQVNGPNLRLSDDSAQYRTAVDAAYDDARARAEAIAAKAGVALGAPVAIVEGGGYGGPAPYGVRTLDAAAEVAIEPGTQDVTATLTVTFAVG
jgi:uncharacterized protein YggE